MGCGCGNGNGGQRKMSDIVATSNYGGTYKCMRCYCKHLSKAVIEYSEFMEDQSRSAELSMCIGDLACAEDHAVALGKRDEASRIRMIRGQVWSSNDSVLNDIRSLASDAVNMVLLEQKRGKSDVRANAALALEAARSMRSGGMNYIGSNDSNDSDDSDDSNDLDGLKQDASNQ